MVTVIHTLTLQHAKALHRRIVIPVVGPVHAGQDPVGFQPRLIATVGVLAALIRMMNEATSLTGKIASSILNVCAGTNF